MKTRLDFVSNSSSSSYLIAIDFKKYDMDTFVRTVCENCDDETDQYHDKSLKATNAAILQYYLRFYERLYLGAIVNGRSGEDYKRGYGYDGEYVGDDEHTPFRVIVHDYIEHPDRDWMKRDNSTARLVDENTVRLERDELIDECFTVPSNRMNHIRGYWSDRDTPEARKERVGKIMKFVEHARKSDDLWMSADCANTYQITMNTIRNTRDMIAEGVKFVFDKYEDLDALEARLNAGDSIVRMECGNSGEGTDDTRVFSESETYCLENVPCEFIASDMG